MHFKICFFLIIILLFTGRAEAQQSQVLFGQNRVQYREFNWKLLTTANFDVYFYGSGKDLAKQAARYAEENYGRITDQVGYSSYGKIKIIVFNSVSEMQQSNVGLERDNYVVGGQTHFVKSKIEVAFSGSHSDFREEVLKGVSAVLINQMLFGGNLKDIVQSSYLLTLPEWFVNGASAYVAHGWSREMDNYVRDLMLNKRIKNPSAYTGEEATIIGQSIWNFIVLRYGRTYMSNIMTLTRIIRNEETSIESIVGIPFSIIIREWESYYKSMASELKNEYVEPDDAEILKKYLSKENIIINPVFNAEQTYLAFAIEKEGRYRIVIRDLKAGKNKTIKYGGSRLVQQKAEPNIPLLAWQSENMLGIVEEEKGKPFLTLVDVKTGKKNNRKLPAFNQITSYSFSQDGKVMVFSADKEGQSDIYLLDIQRNALTQLTNDLYDDLHPVFLNNTSQIVFSSNRFDDTLFAKINHDLAYREIINDFHLYHFNLSDKGQVKRITKAGNNYNPIAAGNSQIYYLCDEKGILNLYKFNLQEGKSYQVTKFNQDIEEYAIGRDGAFSFIMQDEGKKRLHFYENFDFSNSYNTIFTYRQQQLFPTNPVRLEKKESKQEKEKTEEKNIEEEEEINIHDYHFESDKKPKRNNEEAKQSNGDDEEPVLENLPAPVYGPYSYKNFFSLERVTSSVMIHPLRGMGILMQATMSDIMNNHRISAGMFGLMDFRNSNLFAEYKYLKHRVDFGGRFDREIFSFANEVSWHRYIINRIEGTASYPFSQKARVSVSPFVVHTRLVNHSEIPGTNRFNPDLTSFYTGLKYEYVFDNTRLHGLNMPEGTRGHISLETYLNPADRQENFNVFVVDVRKYKRIHRSLTLAGRASYGNFFGNASNFFMLGGMDNWLFNHINNSGSQNPFNNVASRDKSDFMFMRFATNLRGHDYNQQWGDKYFLINGEIRLPVASYFGTGVVGSNFLRNLQFIGFYDMGTAWSGGNPFSSENITRVDEVSSGGTYPFSASVTNYRSPLLIGYGGGIRSMFLGYYLKFDVAWGIAEELRLPRRYYLTFGFDF